MLLEIYWGIKNTDFGAKIAFYIYFVEKNEVLVFELFGR